MEGVSAIGFDLFNTLVTVDPEALAQALEVLISSLDQRGLAVPSGPFKEAYRRHALRFLGETRHTGKETHNRLWVAAALGEFGHIVSPEDERVNAAVEDYFEAFSGRCKLLPGTLETLERLRKEYPLGLLTNFTHAPAARRIIEETGLAPFFRVILISGEVGYRKPYPLVFEMLARGLGVRKEELIYVGDDPGPDIHGAIQAGLRPIWTLYAERLGARHIADLIYRDIPPPDGRVPRISSWDDLIALLASEHRAAES